MKNFKKFATTTLVAFALIANSSSVVFAQFDGGWDTGSVGSYTGGWDTGSVGSYTGGWDTGSVGSYTGGWDTGSVGSYTGGWDTGSTYTAPVYSTPTYTTPTYNYDYSYSTPTYTTPTYTYTTPTYTTPTYTYTTPTYTTPTYTQPVVTNTTIPVVNQTRCSDGTLPNPTTGCTRVNTIPVVATTICADGAAPINGSCVRNNVIPTVATTICSDGSYPVNGSCVRTNVIPAQTVTYQSCWNGTTIPLGSVCPAQYKTCPNGTSVSIYQSCPVVQRPVPPVDIKFNNVITSVATEITNVSARCNGIGLVASGAQSTGWFEYGETSNLGRETAHANIGNTPTAPFSNKLVNLKPATTYYCRAVMNNQYGTVKGEIVAFKTKSTTVTYTKPPVVTTTKTTTVVKTPAKPSTVCVDTPVTSTTPNKAGAPANLSADQKLVAITIEKVSGTFQAGTPVTYKVTVKNLSSESLSGTLVKVTIPQEIVLNQASAGQYDPSVRTLTVDNMPLGANAEGTVLWTGTIAQDLGAGKPMVTTAYANYTVPGSNLQDEVTAYTVGTVAPGTDNNGNGNNSPSGAKNVIGASTGHTFLPNTLVEWLALIAIIFIIFILGRSVYTSMKNDKAASH